MPTVRDILAIMNFERWAGRNDGSCFGVTDPSRLRQEFDSGPIEKEPFRCNSCADGKHECSGQVSVFSYKVTGYLSTGEEKFEFSSREVPCECKTCHGPKLQTSTEIAETDPF
jgi:hypothetical protein